MNDLSQIKDKITPKELPIEERKRIESYLLSLENIKSMLKQGIIDIDDFNRAEAFLAKKYCIKKLSIYRANDLINSPFRVIYMTDQKEVKNE